MRVNSKSIQAALNSCSRLIRKSKDVPSILDNVKIVLNSVVGMSYMYSTDHCMFRKVFFEIDSKVDRQFAVDAFHLEKILKNIPSDDVAIDVDDTNLSIKSGAVKGNFKIRILNDVNDYPGEFVFDDSKAIEINASMLRSMIHCVLYAADKSMLKHIFNAIFFTNDNDNLVLVGSDSRRLAIIRNKTCYFPIDAILPLNAVNEIERILSDADKDSLCWSYIFEGVFYLKYKESIFSSTTIAGKYPNYKNVIPKEFKAVYTLSVKVFAQAIKRLLLFTAEPTYKIIMNFYESGELTLSARSETGEASETVSYDYVSGQKESKIVVNGQFLLDSISGILNNDVIEIAITGGATPFIIRAINDDDFLNVVMPIQERGEQ